MMEINGYLYFFFYIYTIAVKKITLEFISEALQHQLML